MVDFLIGADPEFFLIDKETGKHVSAYGMIEGDKKNPLRVDKGAVQVDGMALEFNIDPASTPKEFDTNITTVLRQLREMIDPRYEFSFVPVAEFGKEYIDAQPKKAKELGCDPDYNAYTGQPNPVPNGGMGIRTASGHVHVGWTKDMDPHDPGHFEACQMLTKQLDAILGRAQIIWDIDEVRRQMYGDFGAFRPKPYGMEYRVLSNAWVNNALLRNVVFTNAKAGAERLLRGARSYCGGYDSKNNMLNEREMCDYIRDLVKKNNLGTAYNLLVDNGVGSVKENLYSTILKDLQSYEMYKVGENLHLFDETKKEEPKKERPAKKVASKKKSAAEIHLRWEDFRPGQAAVRAERVARDEVLLDEDFEADFQARI